MTSTGQSRVVSIDALRGFDMFWIIGADSLVSALRKINDSGIVRAIAEQLEHVPWEGFHFYDLIFPLFVFLVGVSAVFSLDRVVQTHGRAAAIRRVVRRSVLLVLLGIFYYGALQRDGGPEMFRYVGVLQRIGICYFAAGLMYIWLRPRSLVVCCAVLLIGYWAAMTFVPVPGMSGGRFDEGQNLANYVDRHYLPGYKWDGDWDPEGLMSTIPAVATALLGVFAGLFIRNEKWSHSKRLMALVAIGVCCLLAGWAWSWQFPIIKKIWTSSYVLVAGGWSYLLVALFYFVIDVCKLELWSRPFVWIGMNAITIYMLTNLIDLNQLIRRVIHRPMLTAIEPYGELLITSLALLLAVGICYFLYRRRIFLRV
jgi:predicted acyltransferase